MTKKTAFIRHDGLFVGIRLEDILFIATADNYTKLITTDKQYLVRASLVAVLDKLPEGMFERIHRCYAVAVDRVEYIGKDFVHLADKDLPLSRQYFTSFLNSLLIIE